MPGQRTRKYNDCPRAPLALDERAEMLPNSCVRVEGLLLRITLLSLCLCLPLNLLAMLYASLHTHGFLLPIYGLNN